jgi:hypothetical protein
MMSSPQQSALIGRPQVPEDLQSILTDSSLHDGSAELTTKEILQRYGHVGRGNVQASQASVQAADAPAKGPLSASGSNRPTGPLATRVDVDPSQANAWQKQSSVRHVQNAYPAGGNGSGLNAPQQDFNFGAPSSPYARTRSGSQGSQGSFGGGRQSYQPRPGTLGVTS